MGYNQVTMSAIYVKLCCQATKLVNWPVSQIIALASRDLSSKSFAKGRCFVSSPPNCNRFAGMEEGVME